LKNILFVFGTRPEAIKMAPVIKEFQKLEQVDTKVCITAQHRQMLDQVLTFFGIIPDYDLNLMKPRQNLYDLTADILIGLKQIFENYKPDIVLVHGDTTTSFAASLASFYAGVKVAHVEAGLRTNNKWSPFPEEINRNLTSKVADIHFAPTQRSKENLLSENICLDNIVVTGNTVIDALFDSINRLNSVESEELMQIKQLASNNKKIILVTGHRRENFGDGFLNICHALKEIATRNPNLEIIYPVHLNPNVQEPVFKFLSRTPNIKLIHPLSYESFLWLMNRAYIILTDSGGVQEEAPSLGKPVLVMRDTTERPEAVEAGTVILVGTDIEKITTEVQKLINDEDTYSKMSALHNPYGDGKASKRIVDFILNNIRNEY